VHVRFFQNQRRGFFSSLDILLGVREIDAVNIDRRFSPRREYAKNNNHDDMLFCLFVVATMNDY